MFDEIDKAYFDRRAQEALMRAEAAADDGIASIHRAMAREYETKAKNAHLDPPRDAQNSEHTYRPTTAGMPAQTVRR